MYSIQFWKSWPAVYQRLWWLLVAVFVAGLAITIGSFLQSPSPTFSWQQLQELKHQLVVTENVQIGLIDLPVFADNYILYERWATNPLQMLPYAMDIYLFLFVTGLIALLAIITVLPRFWFFAGAGVIVFMLSSLQWEELRIFGLINKIPTIGVMIIVLGVGLYFQFLNNNASFGRRVFAFFIAMIAIGLLIANFADVQQPLRLFAVNTLPTALVAVVLFIIVVAHEILAFFVTLVGQGTRNTKSLRHFLIISIIYLITLWLAYLSRIASISWSFSLPPVLLLATSGIIAIWGIRRRQPTYENILTSDPFAVYLVLSLGTIAFGAIGFFISTSNDIVLLSLNDIILYAHIGYGMMFLFYIASNFLNMLGANFQVWRVLYKPTNMPYVSFRLAGLIFTLAFLFYNNWIVPVNHFISGYYTSLGDLYRIEQNSTWSEGYYKRANFYAPYNQHASTALAEAEVANGHPERQGPYLNQANSFKSTEFTLINAAGTLQGRGLEEILFLDEAHRRVPNSGVIDNNLGLAYSRISLADSAYIYFLKAKNSSLTKSAAEMNLLGLLADKNSTVNADSIYQALGSIETKVKSNLIAIGNQQKKVVDLAVELPKDSLLNLFSATLLGNYILNRINTIDTTFLNQAILIARKKENSSFKEMVLVSAAHASYAKGFVNRAFQLLEEASFGSPNQGRYNTTLGIWAMEQGKPDVALQYTKFASQYETTLTNFANAVALSENGKTNEAIEAWHKVGNDKTEEAQAQSAGMLNALITPSASFNDLGQKEKYYYLHFRLTIADSVEFNQKINQLEDEELRGNAIVGRAMKLYANDDLSQSVKIFKSLQGLHLKDAQLIARFIHFQLRLFASQGQLTSLQEAVDKGIVFAGPYLQEGYYYDALRQAAAGDSLKATINFNWLVRNNSFFDYGIIAAAEFFHHHGADRGRNYSILSEALQVNPLSVKILKAYIIAARERSYEDYSISALATLQSLISPSAFKKYVAKNGLSGLVVQQ